jgi:hypothetical protein
MCSQSSARDKAGIARTCQQCVHFVDDPGRIEAEFPGLTVFGSAFSSARGNAGICEALGQFTDPVPAQSCFAFTLRLGARE